MTRSSSQCIARVVLTAVFFIDGLALGIWATNIPAIKEGLQLTDAALGTALAAQAAGVMLFLLAAGWVASRLGTRRSVVLGGTLFGLSIVLPGIASNYVEVVLAIFLLGATNSILDVSMNSHATLIERDWNAEIMSSFHAAYSFGGLAGAGTTGFLLDSGVSTRTCLTIAAVAVFAVLIVAMRYLGELIPEPAEEEKKVRIFPNYRLLLVGALAFLALFTEAAMIDWTSVYLKDVVGTTTSLAASGYGGFMFCMAIGRLIGDEAIRRLGSGTVFFLGGLISAAGMAIALLFPTPVISVIGFGMIGLGLANCIPMLYTRAAATMPQAPSVGVAVTGTIGYGGFLIGPPLIGFISNEMGLAQGLILVVIAMLLVAAAASAIRRLDAFPHHADPTTSSPSTKTTTAAS